MSLLNTDQKREKEHLAQMLTIARDYARSKGFTGTFLIEPKPMEPTKHQYDVDTETVVGFLKTHGLDKDFKVNIEVNHATLAGHTFEHELAVAVDNGMLGSIDANRGDYQNGWDTDQFPIDNYELTQAMMQIIRNGGLGNGGTNFDAKTTAVRAPEYRVNFMFIGTVRLKYVALFMVVTDLLFMTSGNAGGHIAHLGGALAGWWFASGLSRGHDATSWINRCLDCFSEGLSFRRQSKRPKMKVHYGDKAKDYDYNARKKQQSEEIDRILDKLKKSGYNSLTTEEKKSLFDASKK